MIHSLKDGGDLLVKTADDEKDVEAGYLVPVLDQIARQDRKQGTKAVILTGSAERSAELDAWIRGVGSQAGIICSSIHENGDGKEQKSALLAGPSLVVGTPGRLAELMEENRVIFREAGFLVLDRAEQITDWEAVEKIRQRIIGKCRCIATVSNGPGGSVLSDKLESFLKDPRTVESSSGKRSAEKKPADTNGVEITKDLTQYYIKVPPRMKISTLMAHLENAPAGNVLIFTASRRTADRLYRVFRKSGRRAVSLNSNLDEEVFRERFERFNSGNVDHLIAGELSADRLPVHQVKQVINYDVPEEVLEYKLRADLVGGDKATRIVSLVSKQDRSDIREIISELGYAPEEIPLPEGAKKSSKSRKNQKRTRGRAGRTGGKSPGRQKRQAPEPARQAPGLPRPSYDKLSGGRSGHKEKPGGIMGFFRKLFN